MEYLNANNRNVDYYDAIAVDHINSDVLYEYKGQLSNGYSIYMVANSSRRLPTYFLIISLWVIQRNQFWNQKLTVA